MKIISIRRGFASDHSSTSYEFLAVDKPLSKSARAAVASLSSRAEPTTRQVNFIYHGDGYDIPGGWEALLETHYDVMYSESYDWWILAMAFDADEKTQQEIAAYGFGDGETGIEVFDKGDRVVIAMYCRLELGPGFGDNYYTYYDEDDYEDDNEREDDDNTITDDNLLLLLVDIREMLIQGDYRPLYEIWRMYGFEDDELDPPQPLEMLTGEDTLRTLRNILTTI